MISDTQGRIRCPREARERPHAEPPRGPVVRARRQPAQLPRRGHRARRGSGRRVGEGQRIRVRKSRAAVVSLRGSLVLTAAPASGLFCCGACCIYGRAGGCLSRAGLCLFDIVCPLFSRTIVPVALFRARISPPTLRCTCFSSFPPPPITCLFAFTSPSGSCKTQRVYICKGRFGRFDRCRSCAIDTLACYGS